MKRKSVAYEDLRGAILSRNNTSAVFYAYAYDINNDRPLTKAKLFYTYAVGDLWKLILLMDELPVNLLVDIRLNSKRHKDIVLATLLPTSVLAQVYPLL